VQGFAPTQEDLNYPGTPITRATKRFSWDGALFPKTNAQFLFFQERLKSNEAWYVTLERTLGCLSKVFRVVEPTVFEQLAQEAVAACTFTLLDASKRIGKKATLDDGDLFLIKHLLLLREQISPFHAALSSKAGLFSPFCLL